MSTRECTLLSILLLLIPFAIYFYVESKGIGDLGSLLGASAGVIAIIWFYRGLRLQSLQIEEQRKQFSRQHHVQHQDSLLTFLNSVSERIEKQFKELLDALNLSDLSQLTVKYLESMEQYNEALESPDAKIVLSASQEWMKIEGPCMKFMSAIKDVIILHKMRLELDIEEKEQDVATYVFINSSHLFQQPLISNYHTSVSMLSEQMMLLAPGRKAMFIATSTAMALVAPEGFMKTDKILDEINKQKADGEVMPKICDEFMANKAGH